MKIHYLVLTCALAAGLGFSGCSGDKKEAEKPMDMGKQETMQPSESMPPMEGGQMQQDSSMTSNMEGDSNENMEGKTDMDMINMSGDSMDKGAPDMMDMEKDMDRSSEESSDSSDTKK